MHGTRGGGTDMGTWKQKWEAKHKDMSRTQGARDKRGFLKLSKLIDIT